MLQTISSNNLLLPVSFYEDFLSGKYIHPVDGKKVTEIKSRKKVTGKKSQEKKSQEKKKVTKIKD